MYLFSVILNYNIDRTMFYQSIKHLKSVFYRHISYNRHFWLEIANNILFEGIHDGVLCEVAESFEAEINTTNKEEAKTVEKLVSNGVSLSSQPFRPGSLVGEGLIPTQDMLSETRAPAQ